MIKKNQAEFEKSNILTWLNEVNNGQGVTLLVLDDKGKPFSFTNVETPFPALQKNTNHNTHICCVAREIFPSLRIISIPWTFTTSEHRKNVIDWIYEHKEEIDIINCSFGSSDEEFNRLKDLDIPIVCATGNESKEDTVNRPSRYDWTIAVVAVTESNNHVTSASNKGKEVDCGVYTNIYIPKENQVDKWIFTDTSCASIVGSVMLAIYILWRKENNLSTLGREEVRKFVHTNCIDMYEEGRDYKSGYGLFRLPSEIPTVEPMEDIEEVNNMIIDISHHQVPSNIDYDKLAKQVKLVIIRTQYGSSLIDKYYKTHHAEFKKRGVPTAAYAWVRGTSIKDMEVEAADFYNRTIDLKPTFWFLDVEEKSMNDMRSGIIAYVNKLRTLGVKKIGIYIAHHLYKDFSLNLSEVDAVWIPHYGLNNGSVTSKPNYLCDIHQYTSTGKLDGYSGNLDLNKIISDKTLAYFTSTEEIKEPVVIDEMGIAWEWGIANKITDGTRPDDMATRKEIITMLYRMRGEEINNVRVY